MSGGAPPLPSQRPSGIRNGPGEGVNTKRESVHQNKNKPEMPDHASPPSRKRSAPVRLVEQEKEGPQHGFDRAKRVRRDEALLGEFLDALLEGTGL